MFAIDFTKPYLYKDVVYFHQGNLSTNNTLRCTLNTGGSNDLTGCNIICTFKLQNSTEISGAGRIIDPLNAIVDLVFPSNALAVGLNKLEILVNRSDGSVAQSPSITYDIWQGLTTGNGIEAETNYPILIELINSTNEASNKANSALNKANSMITDITDAIDNAYRSANEADIATSNANTKIEEVETAKTEMIKKVDTSIVTMKSDVETAKNEMSSKADEKIADVDRALAAGTVDLELKASRDGEESLPARLKRDLYIDEVPVKQRVLNLENMKEMQDLEYSTDKGYAVCEKTGNGTVKDLKIYGRSLVSLAKYGDSYSNGDVDKRMNVLSVLGENLYVYNHNDKRILVDIRDKNTNSWIRDIPCEPKKHINITLNSNEKISFIKVAKSHGWDIASVSDDALKLLILDKLVQNPPSYFEGIASVGNGNEIEVSSVNNGNLFDGKFEKCSVNGATGEMNAPAMVANVTTVNLIPIIPSETIKYKSTGNRTFRGGANTWLYWFDKDKKYIDKSVLTTFEPIKAPSNCRYIRISFTDYELSNAYGKENYNINISQIGILDNPNFVNQDKKTPLFKDVDGSWKPVTDLNEFDILDTTINKLTVCTEKPTLSNTDTSWRDNGNAQPGFKTYWKKFEGYNLYDCICDKMPVYYKTTFDKKCVFVLNNAYLYLTIPTSECTDLSKLNEWFIANPMNILIPTPNKKVFEINPIYPEAFEDATLMLFKTGPISPRATWKITSNLPNFVKELSKQVRQLQDQVYKTNVANFTVALNTLDTKLRLDRLEAPQQ